VKIPNDVRSPIAVTNYTDAYHRAFTFQEGCVALRSDQARADQLETGDEMLDFDRRFSGRTERSRRTLQQQQEKRDVAKHKAMVALWCGETKKLLSELLRR